MEVLDRFRRPLANLRVSVTDRCNLRCHYCMPEQDYVWLPRTNILTFEEIEKLVDIFVGLGTTKVRLTGGEPLLRKNLPDLIALLGEKPALTDLALTTNGILLAEQVGDLRAAGLPRITVSLDTLKSERFFALTRFDNLPTVLHGLECAAGAGFGWNLRHLRQPPGSRQQRRFPTPRSRAWRADHNTPRAAFARPMHRW